MTDFRAVALDHVSKGYPVFPCQQDKRPKAKLNDWENVATTDVTQINEWWDEDPNFLPAIPPGRVGLAVIDVDRHVGKDDGFESLDEAGVRLTSNVFGTSLSGNGTHYWHRHAVGSVNGIYPGVDRKAQGGYVVVPYIMPPQSEVQAPLPEELQGGVKASNVARKNLTGAQLNSWLYDVGEGVPDDEMWEAVEKMQDRGHQQMVASVARVASLAAEGHPGASTALERMQDKWLEGDHNSGDPETDFLSAVRSAIEKFGDRPPDTTLEDKWKALLASVDQASLNTHELAEALRVYSRSLNGDWESNAKASAMYQRCVALIPQIESVDDVRKWLIGAKKIMKSALA